MKLGKPTEIDYQHSAYGTWGHFDTSAGEVDFLETKARLGTSGIDKESRLTKLLLPVREILDLKQLDFNQLLQRDLDDHRVAQKLVPYVLRPQATGPAYFPPLVAALLPFNGKIPQDQFPTQSTLPMMEDHLGHWAGYAHESAFKFQKSVTTDGNDFEVRIGRLSWNPEEAKLVVIDGQHRAMALIAIDRTLNNTWPGTGEKYRHFYETVINDILKDLKSKNLSVDFSKVEFPVNIVWFPKLDYPTDNQQKAARKLFVDLNGNAKPPSLSRLMLLSDTELVNIFARRLLKEFRQADGPVPIYAVEYDHPERYASAPGKWSTMSSLGMIAACVKRSVFGPEKYISSVNVPFGSRESDRDTDKYMRERLKVDDFLPEVIQDGDRTIKRSEVGNVTFPLKDLPTLEERYRNTWGTLIIEMLQNLAPYRAHADALKQMYAGWAAGDSFASLAKDSIFEGVGMYWTLRDAADSFKKSNEDRKLQNLPTLAKTDVVKAWDEIENKQKEFSGVRTKVFLDTKATAAITLSDEAFTLFNSHACQLGFVLTAASIVHREKTSLVELPKMFKVIVEAANASLLTGPASGRPYGRRTVFVRSEKNAINAIKKLDTPFAPHFRYFWLELLATPEATAVLESVISMDTLRALRDDARQFYFDFLESEASKSIKSLTPALDVKKIAEKAEASASDQMKKALERWFGVSIADFTAWKDRPKPTEQATPTQPEPTDAGELAAEATPVEVAAEDEEEASVEDLLKGLST